MGARLSLVLAPIFKYFMANKEEILRYIEDLSSRNVLTRDELLLAYDSGSKTHLVRLAVSEIFANILIYLGGLLIFCGAEYYFYKKIIDLSYHSFLLLTAGIGVGFYVVAMILSKKDEAKNIAPLFFIISSVLIGAGAAQFLFRGGVVAVNMMVIINAVLVFLYLAPFLIFRKSIFLFFTIIFTASLFVSLAQLVILNFGLDHGVIMYLNALIGLAYIYLARLFLARDGYKLSPWLYGFGTAIFLSSILCLGGLSPNQSQIWEAIFMLIFMSTVIAGFNFGSKSMVIISNICFLFFVAKLAWEYLVINAGLAIIPIICGLSIIFSVTLYNYFKGRFFYD